MLRLAALTALLLAAHSAGGEDAPVNTCVDCHGDLLEEAGGDIHRAAGFSCVDCHGGDPRAEEQDRAMSPARGYVGVPTAMAAANMCGHCHSDIERMRVINPRLPTDQLAQYRTSDHGKLAARGDEKVATCVSCHGSHGVRPVGDPASPAGKSRVVETCSGCHNPSYMEGRSIPTDQLPKYEQSVHGRKRLEERDLAAPACNDCHGNHGAAPPGVSAVTHVCGRCHATQAELFEGSTHASHFRDFDAPPCTTCHNHHEILATSDDMLGTGERGVCSACHTPGDPCDEATKAMKAGMTRLGERIEQAHDALGRARRLGMDVERPTFELAGSEDALVRARATIHAFSEERTEAVVKDGVEIATAVETSAESKLAEYQYRRRGLAVAAAMLLLFAGLLALRAHRLEKRRLQDGP
jgi:predicted CXXCH cytochrome family protein